MNYIPSTYIYVVLMKDLTEEVTAYDWRIVEGNLIFDTENGRVGYASGYWLKVKRAMIGKKEK